jgi:cytochrome c553
MPAAASGEMLKVVSLSTSRLSDADLDAMLRYLRGDQPPEPVAVPVASGDTEAEAAARGHYLALCAGCHGPDGSPAGCAVATAASDHRSMSSSSVACATTLRVRDRARAGSA